MLCVCGILLASTQTHKMHVRTKHYGNIPIITCLSCNEQLKQKQIRKHNFKKHGINSGNLKHYKRLKINYSQFKHDYTAKLNTAKHELEQGIETNTNQQIIDNLTTQYNQLCQVQRQSQQRRDEQILSKRLEHNTTTIDWVDNILTKR